MNRHIAAWLGAGLFGLGLIALADEPHGKDKGTTPEKQTTPPTTTSPATVPPSPGTPPMPSTPSTTSTPSTDDWSAKQPTSGKIHGMHGKHFALVNVNLGYAILNAKALGSLSDMEMPYSEAHMKECARNLDMALKNALVHVGHIKKLNDPSFTRLIELDRALKETKVSLAKLKKAKHADLDAQIDQIGSQLGNAEHIFRDMAKTANFTLLEETSLRTVPVRGTEGIEKGTEPKDPNAIPPKKDTDMLPEPARPTSPPSDTPKY